MPRVEIALTITVHGALAVAGGARDARGDLVLRGSHVKGRFRHACEQAARALGLPVCQPPDPASMCPNAPGVGQPPCSACTLFGAPAWPSPLRWADLRAEAAAGPTGAKVLPTFVRAGVALDRRLGTAVADAAYLVETSPALPGAAVRFASERAISGHLDDPALLPLLLAGARLVTGMGAGATRGLGWSEVQATARLDGEPVVFEPAALARLAEQVGG
ncbi:MAG TPA: RAMP superfamily CRISPR-associated protein [Chloroflexota bacterium]|jgi:CRISPR/Cas system CSM-associated protein Csm3 (group 7 of RAMP superfamily)